MRSETSLMMKAVDPRTPGTERRDGMPDRGSGAETPAAGEWLWSVLTVTSCTIGASMLSPYLESADLAMIYLLGVVVVAGRTSMGPSLAAAVLSIAAFDYFFVPPHYTFAVSEAKYIVTFLVMFVVSIVISRLTQRIRRQAAESGLRERRTAALYSMSKELAGERDAVKLQAIAAKHVGETFDSGAVVLFPDGEGRIPAAGTEAFHMDEREQQAAQWALDNRQPSGANIPTGPDADASYVPLVASRGTVGVVGLRPRTVQGWLDPGQLRYLEAFTNQVAMAIERSLLVEETHRAVMHARTESLRNTLLSSISHDLRTPLTAVTGAASTLIENDASLDREDRLELVRTIQEEGERLSSIIANVLAMTRLESGDIRVNKEWQSLEEIVGVVLNRFGERLSGRSLKVDLPEGLPLIPFDALLLEQVLMNLIENALKYTPKGTPLELSASESFYTVTVSLADRGPGIPPGEEERIFEKFSRGPGAGGGVGLGLAICRAIINAHGGKIWAEAREGGGATFRFTLSSAGIPPMTKKEGAEDR
jgi:two-component system sensor histidine kinase KdpD